MNTSPPSAAGTLPSRPPVLLCLSHLRRDFVLQRPQRLMSQAAAECQVVFLEEPLPDAEPGEAPGLDLRRSQDGVPIARPKLPPGLDAREADAAQRQVLDRLLAELAAPLAVAWFYASMALAFAGHLRPAVTAYDCMNLHWLGMRAYADLPAYLAGWRAGLMPFALDEATRFIGPTEAPEFLAAGVPLVSTPVADVVSDWAPDGLVEIADGPGSVVTATEPVLVRPLRPWLTRVGQRLAGYPGGRPGRGCGA